MDPNKANRVVAGVFQHLGTRFSICAYEAGNPWIFGIAEKAPPGQSFDETEQRLDGSIVRKRIKDHGGITTQQFQIIVDTSLTEAEAIERVIQLIIKKIDTTRIVIQKDGGLTVESIQQIVQKAIAEDRATRQVEEKRIAEIAAAATVRAPAEVQVEDDSPQGLQQRPRVSRHQQSKLKQETIEIWRDRARQLGHSEPRLAMHGNVDKRWIRHFEPKWQAYIAGKQPQPTA